MKEAKSAKEGDIHDICVSLEVEKLCKEEEIKKAKKQLENLEMDLIHIEEDFRN